MNRAPDRFRDGLIGGVSSRFHCHKIFAAEAPMKWMVLAVICTTLMVNGQESKSHRDTDKRNPTSERKDSTDTAGQTVIVVNRDAPQRQENNYPAKPPSYFTRLLSPENFPNLALVAVGIAGIVVAIRSLKAVNRQIGQMQRQIDVTMLQLRAMNEQISEMSQQTASLKEYVDYTKTIAETGAKSADAALLNAKALINAERPWVMVHIKKTTGERGRATFQIKAFNYGKSPAHIVDVRGPKIEFYESPDDLPIPPDYGTGQWSKRFLAPNTEFPLAASIDPANYALSERTRSVIAQVEQGKPLPKRQGSVLVIYGLIQYTDGVANTTYKTPFCYCHNREFPSEIGGLMVLCGPPIYNEYS